MEANACVRTASRSYLESKESGFAKCSVEWRMDCDSGLLFLEDSFVDDVVVVSSFVLVVEELIPNRSAIFPNKVEPPLFNCCCDCVCI